MRINLAALGWQRPQPWHWGELDAVARNQTIAVDAHGRVLVGFTTRDSSQQLATRANPGWHFHVLRFAGGQSPDLSLEVATNNWRRNGVYLDARNDVIVRANDRLLLLLAAPAQQSKGAAPTWRELAPCGPKCVIVQSLSRRTFYLTEWDAPFAIVVDMDGPQVRECDAPPGLTPSTLSISDIFAYWNYDQGNPPYPPPVLYRWPLCDPTRREALPITAEGMVYPLTDPLLLFPPYSYPDKGPVEFVISSTDGKIEARIRLPLGKRESAGLIVSQNGRRLALDATTLRGGVSWLDISPHLAAERIIALDVKDGRELASFPVVPASFASQLAIGPGGHRVGVLTGGELFFAYIP